MAIGAFALAGLGLMRRPVLADRSVLLTAWLASLAFLGLMLHHVVISHVDDTQWVGVIHALASVAALLVAASYPLYAARRPRACLALLLGALAALIAARGCVLLASPKPWIDVFTLANEAAAAFWRGDNPYAAAYGNLYAGTPLDLGYSPGYNYFPAMLLSNALSAKLFHDVRAVYVLAEGLCTLFLARIARALGWSWQTAAMIALLWCANSLSFQVVEKWNDSLPLAALFGTLAFLAERRYGWAGLVFGLGCATKQYLPLAAAPIVLWLWKTEGQRVLRRFVLLSGAGFVGVCAPYLVSQPQWFVQRTLLHFANTPFRGDSISLLNGLRRLFSFRPDCWVVHVSPYVGLAFGLICTLALMARCRQRQPAAAHERCFDLHCLVLALLFVWAGFFHSIKQSHLNYHYFYFSLGCLLLLSMVERKTAPQMRRKAEAGERARPRSTSTRRLVERVT